MQQQVSEIRRAMKPVADVLRDLDVLYAVVGSVAGLSHGYSRFTMDIDTVAFLSLDVVDQFVGRLKNDYYVDATAIREAITHHRSFNLICNANGFKVDIFVPISTAWQQQVVQRCEPETMNDERQAAFLVETAEDLVLSKLRWFRMTNETLERQWNDVLGVLKINCFDIDTEYLEYWAKELRIEDLLKRAFDESGIEELKGTDEHSD